MDKKWAVTFWHPLSYEKYVAKDSWAEIDYNKRVLDVRLDNEYIEETLRHELTHCYAKERSIVEANIKGVDQAEEFFAEINGKHGHTLVKQAAGLARFGGRIRWK